MIEQEATAASDAPYEALGPGEAGGAGVIRGGSPKEQMQETPRTVLSVVTDVTRCGVMVFSNSTTDLCFIALAPLFPTIHKTVSFTSFPVAGQLW